MFDGEVTETVTTLTPTHAQTHGRRYRYYVERRRGTKVNAQDRPVRLPAAEIEASVCSELASYLSDPIKLVDGLGLSEASQELQSAIRDKAKAFAKQIMGRTMESAARVLFIRLVKQVVLAADMNGYALRIDLSALAEMLDLQAKPDNAETSLVVELSLKVCNNGEKVIIGNKPSQVAAPNPTLIAALKSAHDIKARYMEVDGKPLSKIAADLNMDTRQVWRSLKLAYLAPDIQLAILSGTQPKGLLLKDLVYQSIPTAWDQQRKLFVVS